jgi:hypothetical protein
MGTAPKRINDATVVLFTHIDERHRHTGNCRQIVGAIVQPPAAGLAICQYDGEDSFYLFGCDESWSNISDTWHQTLEEALLQAEFEYHGVGATWQRSA